MIKFKKIINLLQTCFENLKVKSEVELFESRKKSEFFANTGKTYDQFRT